jgi:hypothetical protein
MERQPGGCLLAAASTVNITAARIFACPIAGGGTVYDLKLRNKICDLLDPHGKAVALGAIDPAAWLDITAQIDPRGEFIGVRQVGRNEDGFGIWRADTGRPIYLSGDLAAKVSTKKRKRAEWGEKNVPGVVGVTGVGWTADGGWVVVIDQEGAVFVKNHLLSADAHKIRGALLSDVLDHTDVHGHWSPVKFPVRVLSKERLLIGNYVIDTETWTVLVELPKAAEIAPDNSVVATWTNTGDLELCDMSFWRAYKGGASESLRLREQLLQWQIGESDKSVAASGSVH